MPLLFLPPPGIFITLCLLCSMTHAFRPKLESGSSLFVTIVKRDISLAKDSHNFDQSIRPVNPVEASTESLGPDWPVLCIKPGRPFALSPVKADCQHISTEIKNSVDATAFRVYKQAEGGLNWSHGGCLVSLASTQTGSTDVFQPVLIARDIMRVVVFCAMTGFGGATTVGPRKKFTLVVTNSRVEFNGTVAAE